MWVELKPLLRDQLRTGFVGEPALFGGVSGNGNGNPPPPALFQLASGYWVSQAVYVVAKLGIADFLANGPRTSHELAVLADVKAEALFRVMRALSSVGVFRNPRADQFELAPLGNHLRSGVAGSLRSMIVTLGEIHYQACGQLLQSVQTGLPAFNNVFGSSLFDYLAGNPAASTAFNQGMTNLASMLAYAVAIAYDFTGISNVVDIGGGQGKFLGNLLELNAAMQGTVFDMPSAIQMADRHERCSYCSGTFFDADSLPKGADAYFLCGIVHDWDDERAAAILANCRKAMPKHGRLLLVEMVVPEDNASSFSKILDLNMLVMNGGRERTEKEFRSLLERSGCKLSRIIPTVAPQSIVEATAM